MGSPRLKLETGARDEDVRDDTSRGGLFHRTPRPYRRHPTHPVDHRCAVCGAVVHDSDRELHATSHRFDEEWQDKTDWLEEQLVLAYARIKTLEDQHELIAKTFGHALAPLVEADLVEAEETP